jgi:hypothetical protein
VWPYNVFLGIEGHAKLHVDILLVFPLSFVISNNLTTNIEYSFLGYGATGSERVSH